MYNLTAVLTTTGRIAAATLYFAYILAHSSFYYALALGGGAFRNSATRPFVCPVAQLPRL